MASAPPVAHFSAVFPSQPLAAGKASNSPPRPSSSSPSRSRNSSIGAGSGGSGTTASGSHRSRSAEAYTPPSSTSASPTELTSAHEAKNQRQQHYRAQPAQHQSLASWATTGGSSAGGPLGLAIRQSPALDRRVREDDDDADRAASRRVGVTTTTNGGAGAAGGDQTGGGRSLLATSWSWSTF
jgi:hypothetical protein